MSSPSSSSPSRLPTYFLSIGGPNFIENTQHPAYAQLKAVGHQITHKVKPKAIVVLSAHWQADSPNQILVNAAEDAELIYDFYGFPKSYYEVEYPNRGGREVAEKVMDKLERLIVDNEDPEQHYRLGEALAPLRDEGILIVGAGMAVHNLHDFRAARARGTAGETMPYAYSFDDALKNAASSPPEHRKVNMLALLLRCDARSAHPTLEHLMPMYVAAGAAGRDEGERLWTMADGSLNWAQYKFGGK
ncbi:hypothetical protein N0V83_002575 [Neocucurbitaria cava]|uniref:Extradiol ring-cleavage dioxygenase class III enzyme subunit B domain-containing protein n=1 Tax=Neocucurbitaria cava TaxID=798079 RepID=A0A9W8YD09_9PLEO|nr:hypothetical protein N0V83_002575 [Neocucurbitaria cava]